MAGVEKLLAYPTYESFVQWASVAGISQCQMHMAASRCESGLTKAFG